MEKNILSWKTLRSFNERDDIRLKIDGTSTTIQLREANLRSFGGGKQKCKKPIFKNSFYLFRQQEIPRKAKYLM